MSVVKNTFSTTLSSTTIQTYTITGLTSSDSTTSITYMCPEASLYYLRSIYQTLIDAGYTDVSKNESEYSITLFGFKFYTLVKSSASSWKYAYPIIYVHGVGQYFYGNSSTYALNTSASTTLSFNIRVIGDTQNITYITQGSYKYPNDLQPLLFLAKSKNLLTSEEAFTFGKPFIDGLNVFHRNKSDLYTYYSSTSLVSYDFCGYHSYDSSTESDSTEVCSLTNYGTLTAIIPVVTCNGSFLVYGTMRSHTKAYNVPFVRGSYLQINGEIYHIINNSIAGSDTTEVTVIIKVS